MSALSTPGGGGTTAQNKPTSGKQKFQKLDINSLYCANRNESSEPSLVKSQLSRKHGMQSLGKVPSARRPPANLPSLKTETGQDPNTNSVSVTTTTVSTPSTCTSQTTTTTSSNANAGAGGWVPLPPPSSPHFRTEFPSLEASAQPSHRSTDHTQPQPSLRPQTEGSWTCGGVSRNEPPPTTAAPPAQQTPAFRAILPPFLMKGSSGGGGGGGGGGGLGGLGALGGLSRGPVRMSRAPPPQPPRAVEVLTARPILREEQISSLDDIRDAGWAQHDDIDYDQKLDFSDGESQNTATKSNSKGGGGRAAEVDSRAEPGDEEQLWAERRQKQNNEVAQAVLRARQRKEEEQRRQNAPNKDIDCKEQNENRDKERADNRERDRIDRDRFERDRRDNRDRADPDKDRMDARDRDRFERERERSDRGERERDRQDRQDRDRQDRDRQDRDRQDRDRQDRDRQDRDRQDRDRQDRDRQDRGRQDRDRQDHDRQDRDRQDRDRQDRGREDRDRQDRDRPDRDRADRERADRDRNDRDFRERDRDYGRDRGDRDRNQSNPAFSKTFQANIPPRFQKQQQSQGRQDSWAFNKPPQQPRRPEPAYAAPRHNRRSFSRDSDREDDYRRETAGPQWRSEMQDYERPARELDRSNSKESYKDYEYKERRGDSERRSIDGNIEPSSRTAADKLSEVFERKSVGLVEPFAATENAQPTSQDRRVTPPSVQRDSVEKEFGKTSWADVAQDEANKQHAASKPPAETPRATPPRSSPDPPSNNTNKYQANQAPAQNFASSHNTSNMNVLTSTATTPYQSHSTPVDTQPAQKPNDAPKSIVNDPSSSVVSEIAKPQQTERPPQNGPQKTQQKVEKDIVESGTPSTQAAGAHSNVVKPNDTPAVESAVEGHRRPVDDRRNDRYGNDQSKLSGKEPVERKSSGSGSEKKGRRYSSSGYAVYGRGWGRDGRGRRPGRSSRSHTRASESDASTDTAPPPHERRRRRAPPTAPPDAVDTREAFAPRGQPSRRGRGGFQGAPRANVPPKRVAGYGPPNTKSPFSQINRVKDSEEAKDGPVIDDKTRPASKGRAGSTGGRGRDRRGRGPGGPVSGEDDNWETTSEHSEGGGAGARRRSGNRQQGPPAKGLGPRGPAGGQRPGGRGGPPGRNDNKPADVTEAMNALKLTTKKDEEVVDDGFQEVRNKKNSKDSRGPPPKEEIPLTQKPRSHSNQGNGRNGSTSRNPNEKTNLRGSAPVPGKPGLQYDRPRQANLAPRFVKQRQKQQMGMTSGIGPDTGAAPPPPTVNAWDKPIAQTLRGTVEESGETEVRSAPPEAVDTKPTPSAIPTPCAIADKAGVLDGTTPPVETIIFENTNYKNAPPAEALKQKYQQSANVITKATAVDEQPIETEARPLPFNGDNRPQARTIQELIESGQDAPSGLALPIQFESPSKPEDSSDMKLDFAFAQDLGLTEEKTSKSLGLPRGVHMSTSNTISPLAADLNQKIASVKKVWEMPAVAEGAEELQFAGFEEGVVEPGAQPNVCKVKPTQQLQSPPPQHYNHVGYQGGYGGLSVSSPPAVMFNSSQQLLGSSQQLPQQGGLYGFLDQSRGQFGGFPATPYGAGSAAPYNYQPADMFQSLPNQYRMAAAGGAAAFGQSGQLGNSPSTVLISSTSNSLMSATVKPTTQQIGAIGSKGGAVGGVGGVNTFQQQYLGYSGPEAQYSLQGLLPRPAPPANSYYSPYQPGAGPAPTYPLQFTQPAQSGAFGSQFLSSQLQVAAAAAVQQMQQQYRAPMQQQFARPPAALKSPLHEHNGMPEGAPSPKPPQKPKPPHSPPHKYHPHHQHYQHPHQQMVNPGNNGRCGGGGGAPRAAGARYPAPIQRPPAPGAPPYRPPARHAPPRLYYQQHQRNGCGERAADADAGAAGAARTPPPPPPADLPPPELPAE